MKLKKSLKHNLAEAWQKTKDMTKTLLGYAVDYAAATVIIVLGLFLSLRAPEMHNKFIRDQVGSKVYMIRDSVESGGGTGFAIKAPSGQSYILTNDHVCGVSKDGKTVLVSDDSGNMMRRNIIAHDENSDLCLVEGLPGVEGLGVAKYEPTLGDTLRVVGHPALLPLTLSMGEMIAKEDIMVPMGPISVINPNTGAEEQVDPKRGGVLASQCKMNKNRQIVEEMNFFWFIIKVKWCVVVVEEAYTTNVEIRGGNSGSPVVNFWGSVEGVAFAADDENWGRMVPHKDIKRFLKNY